MDATDMQPPPEPEVSPATDVEAGIEPSPATKKPRRKRRTKTEMEAARAEKATKALEEANKPIDPQVWMLLGGGLLVVGAIIFFIPGEFYDNGQTSNNQPWIYFILLFITALLGKNPTAILLAALGLLSLGWGVWGWMRKTTGR